MKTIREQLQPRHDSAAKLAHQSDYPDVDSVELQTSMRKLFALQQQLWAILIAQYDSLLETSKSQVKTAAERQYLTAAFSSFVAQASAKLNDIFDHGADPSDERMLKAFTS